MITPRIAEVMPNVRYLRIISEAYIPKALTTPISSFCSSTMIVIVKKTTRETMTTYKGVKYKKKFARTPWVVLMCKKPGFASLV